MAYCGKCGAPLEDGVNFCPSCGAPVNSQQPQQAASGQPQPMHMTQQSQQTSYTTRLQDLNRTADTTAQFDSADIQQNKVMAVLSYIGILVLIPLLAAKDSKFARFHANQGLILLLAEAIYGVALNLLSAIILAVSWRLYFLISILGLLSIAFLVLAILGIVNAVGGKAKELPVIGKIQLLK